MKDGLPNTPSIGVWLSKHFKEGDSVGVDPNLMSTRTWNTLTTALETSGCLLKPIDKNLIDLVWTDQPAKPDNAVFALDVKYAGKTIADKLKEVREKMVEQNANVLVITALDEIACKN